MISIIISIYNIEKYLKKCLTSVLENDLEDVEVLLINDGSTDSSEMICEEFCKKNSNFKYYKKKNGGCTSARNYGLGISKGQYIFFIDGDDWIESDLLSKIKKVIGLYKPDVINFNYFKEYKDFSKKKKSSNYSGLMMGEELQKIKNNLLYNKKERFFRFSVLPAFWSKIIKRDLIENNICDNEKIVFGEDLCVTLFALSGANSILFIDDFLYHYRQNIESITKSYDCNRNEKIRALIQYLDDKIRTLGSCYSIQYSYYKLFLFRTCILNESKNINFKDSKKKLIEAMDILSVNTIWHRIPKVKSLSANILFKLVRLKFYYIALVLVRVAFYVRKRKFKNG